MLLLVILSISSPPSGLGSPALFFWIAGSPSMLPIDLPREYTRPFLPMGGRISAWLTSEPSLEKPDSRVFGIDTDHVVACEPCSLRFFYRFALKELVRVHLLELSQKTTCPIICRP